MFAETSVLNLEGQRVPESLIQDFKTRLRGRLLRPGMDGYEDSRRIWNSNVVKRPSLIARCSGVADVVNSVNFRAVLRAGERQEFRVSPEVKRPPPNLLLV